MMFAEAQTLAAALPGSTRLVATGLWPPMRFDLVTRGIGERVGPSGVRITRTSMSYDSSGGLDDVPRDAWLAMFMRHQDFLVELVEQGYIDPPMAWWGPPR